MSFLLEDLFDVKDIDQDGKKFDNGEDLPFSPSPPVLVFFGVMLC